MTWSFESVSNNDENIQCVRVIAAQPIAQVKQGNRKVDKSRIVPNQLKKKQQQKEVRRSQPPKPDMPWPGAGDTDHSQNKQKQ